MATRYDPPRGEHMADLSSSADVVRMTALMASMRDTGAPAVMVQIPHAGLATQLWLMTIDQALGGLMQMTSQHAQQWVADLCTAMPPHNPMYLGRGPGVFF